MSIINKYLKIRYPNHKAIIKDEILKLLDENAVMQSIESIQRRVYPFNEELISEGTDLHVSQFCYEMQQAGHIICSDPNAFLHKNGTNYSAQIILKGSSFYYIEGGYTAQLEEEVKRDIWLFLKSLAAVINGLAIIILTYQSYKVSDKSKSLEEERDRALKSAIQYKREADSLKAIAKRVDK